MTMRACRRRKQVNEVKSSTSKRSNSWAQIKLAPLQTLGYDTPAMEPGEPAFPLVPARARTIRLRLGVTALLLLLFGAAALWTWREPVLTEVGGLLVEETPPAPSDLVAVFDNEVPAAATAADLLAKGYAPRILLFKPPPGPDEKQLDRLRIQVPTRHELAILVMHRLGVASEAIVVEPIAELDTNVAIQATARYARMHDVTRVIVVTYRSHTRRTALLLRRTLGRSAVVIVRASPDDPFHPEGWWRDRRNSREFVMESIRWINSLLLGDLWRE
jgi:hypothetical protein